MAASRDARGPGPLPLDVVDLAGVADALADNEGMTSWWLDPTTGEVVPTFSDWSEDDDVDPEEQGWVFIEPEGSRPAYRDMADFAEAVGDPRAHDLLQRSLGGRGAFRRFRDAMYELPALQEHWIGYRSACAEMRAIEWLVDHALVDGPAAEAALAVRRERTASILDEVAAVEGPVVELAEVPERWAEIAAWLAAGTSVTLTRAGRTVATIDPRS